MNIFVVDTDPTLSAQQLPDRHVTKMILESAQMLSIVFSNHYWGIGQVMKVDGTPFKTEKGAFKNHPCTQWVAEYIENCAWLIQHGQSLCSEFRARYGKPHGLEQSLLDTESLFQRALGDPISIHNKVESFARAMPEDLKYNSDIDDVTAYRQYLNTKTWAYYNYLRIPERRPSWLLQPSIE